MRGVKLLGVIRMWRFWKLKVRNTALSTQIIESIRNAEGSFVSQEEIFEGFSQFITFIRSNKVRDRPEYAFLEKSFWGPWESWVK